MQQDVTENKGTFPGEDDLSSIMASHLPPRSEYHKRKRTKGKRDKKKKKKEKERDSHPFITVFAIIFVLLPIIVGSYFFFREINNTPIPVDRNSNFDRVEIDWNQDGDK